jgi:6-pyruvoyltetrahydropterin/6-carboxytetrahydropterin synthase
MSVVRVTKEFDFEMAHALLGYNGPCKDIHGHSYKLSVTVKGRPVTDEHSPESGIVIDFSILKDIVRTTIIEHFDQALVLNKHTPLANLCGISGKLILTPYQPTCENLLLDFVEKLSVSLPGNIELHHLKLRETATSYAEWYANDN